MHKLIRLTLVLCLASSAAVSITACGDKKSKVEALAEEDTTNPKKLFAHGVAVLQAPDKTGAIDYDTAYNDFKAAAEHGGGAKASFNAGWVAEVMGDKDMAANHYRAAYEADKAYEPALFSLARVLNETGRGDDAVVLYQDYLTAAGPDSEKAVQIRNDLIVALTAAERYDEALSQAQLVLRKNPENADAYRALSAMYFKQGRFGLSQLCNEKALALNEGDVGTYNNMAVTHYLQGDQERAIDKFKTARKLDSKSFEPNMNLGFIAVDSGDYTLALECFKAATAANPTSLEAKIGLAIALRGTGELDKAASMYNDLLKAEPSNQLIAFNAATLHEKYTKDYNKALKILQGFVDASAGKIGPNHEVFARMERVNASKAAEEERQRQEEERRKAEEERKKRNEQLLADLKATVDAWTPKVEKAATCVPEGYGVEEAQMLLEQTAMVVEAGEADMAPDLKSLLDPTLEVLEYNMNEFCGGGGGGEPPPGAGGGGAPDEGGEAPAEGGGEAPAEGGGEAPAEGGGEAPAEGGGI